jgi:hypothetical protein
MVTDHDEEFQSIFLRIPQITEAQAADLRQSYPKLYFKQWNSSHHGKRKRAFLTESKVWL